MRFVVYLRVSTDRQAEEGQGLAIQETECRLWLRRHGHRLAAVCTDSGRSGGDDVATREGLAHALALAYSDGVDGILVHRLDRLARDMILQEQLLAELHRMGKRLASCSAAEDENLGHSPDDPQRAFIRRVLGAHAQYERDVIRLRLRAGRERKAMLGGYAGGPVPYGWQAVGGELVPVVDEQAAIRRMRRWRNEGLSYRAIGAKLAETGAPLPRRASAWRPATVAQIVARAENRREAPKTA